MKSAKHYLTVCFVLLVLLALLGNQAWLAGRRHTRFREESWRALDSLAYQADELKKYQHQMMQMLFYGDGKPLVDTFLLVDPDGAAYTFDDWFDAVCPARQPEEGVSNAVRHLRADVSDPSTSSVAEDVYGTAAAAGTEGGTSGTPEPFVVVFRYTELDCMTCTERQIEILQQVCAAHPELKCVILASYAYDALLWQFVRMNQIALPIYQIPSDAVYGEVGVPFYFVLDRSRRYHHAFVPHKLHDEWTEAYLNELAVEARKTAHLPSGSF